MQNESSQTIQHDPDADARAAVAARADETLFALCENEVSAGIKLIIELLRSMPRLREWFLYAQKQPLCLQRLDELVEGKITIPPDVLAEGGQRLLAWITYGGIFPRRKREPIPNDPAQEWIDKIKALTYGGLSRLQVSKLVRFYQAGTIDTGPFMLANGWRQDKPSFALLNLTASYCKDGFRNGQPQLIHQLARAADFFNGHPPGTIGKVEFGHAIWKKLQILKYMLQNPKPTYRTGEFVWMLKAQNIHCDPKDIRDFCKKHNIALDSRRGRPTKKEEAK